KVQSLLDIYDWDKKKLLEKIPIEPSGINRVTNFQGFYFPITKDSLLFPVTIGRIYIMKNREVVLKKYFNNYNQGFVFYVTNSNPIIKHKNDAILYAITSKHTRSTPEVFLNRDLTKYSLKKDTLVHLNIDYPDFFTDKCWSSDQYKPIFTKKNNYLYVLFGAGGKVIQYNLDSDKIINRIPLPKSKFVDWSTPKPLNKCGEYAMPTSWVQDAQKPIHYALKYDKYKDIFYKITHLPVKDIDIERKGIIRGQKNANIKPISLMVLDNKLRVIDEIKLPAKTYDARDFFVSKQGLYISVNNELSPKFNEDALRFDLFELQ
ncbi:MAG: hypothetical protein ACK5H1_08215, partial [Tenacibaculum sp.]